MKFLTTTAIVLALGAGAVATTAVLAQDTPRGPGMMDFEAMDADGDGKVTREEAEAYRAARFAAADANGDGVLDRDELVAAARVRMEARMAERARKAAEVAVGRMMARHDTDGDGRLSAEEQAAEMPMRMFDRLDRDNDGAISLEEAQAARSRMERRMERRDRDDDRPHRRMHDDDRGWRMHDDDDDRSERRMRRFEERRDAE
jgi:hypothetical protein